MDKPLMEFKSHINGKNADVRIYKDRVEWGKTGVGTGTKLTAGLITGGLSLAVTGISGKKGSEMIPMAAITSVASKRDGLRFTVVNVASNTGVIGFRVGHSEAESIRALLTELVLNNGRAVTNVNIAPPAPPVAAAAPPEDVMQKLRQLGELRDAGVLTEGEFETKKAQLLSRM